MRINSFTIGSFTATTNTHVSNGGATIKSFQGLESPERRLSRFNLSGRNGAFITNRLYGGRTLTISVQIFGSSVSDFESRAQTFLDALDFSGGEVTMTIVSANGVSYQVSGDAQIVSDGPAFGERRFGTYIFEFFCSDHRILSQTLNSQTIMLPDDLGGAAIPTAVPVSLGVGSGGTQTITNNGNLPAELIITVYGPLTASITLHNITSDEKFVYGANISAGNYIVIDTKNRSVVDQNGVNALNNVSSSFRKFFTLQPGDNEINFSHDAAYNADANAVFQWRDSYLGI